MASQGLCLTWSGIVSKRQNLMSEFFYRLPLHQSVDLEINQWQRRIRWDIHHAWFLTDNFYSHVTCSFYNCFAPNLCIQGSALSCWNVTVLSTFVRAYIQLAAHSYHITLLAVHRLPITQYTYTFSDTWGSVLSCFQHWTQHTLHGLYVPTRPVSTTKLLTFQP